MSLKVFNLSCPFAHEFEGWFASAEVYHEQLQQQLIECPYCGSTQITKKLSAPYVNRFATGRSEQQQKLTALEGAALMQGLRKLISETEDVGERFPEEARKIHRGQSEERSIRGQATPAQTEELVSEGIQVLSIPSIVDPSKLN